MEYWLVRSESPSTTLSGDGASFTILSRRAPRIAVGDIVVLLDPPPKQTFRWWATVSEVVQKPTAAEGDKVLTQYMLNARQGLPEELDLDVMKFSLTMVTNTSRPDVHFRRGYRRLPKDDYLTLKVGDAFVARTGFFELLNALPADLRAGFLAQEIVNASSPTATRSASSYKSRLRRLYAFIDESVIAAGRLLMEIGTATEQLDLVNQNGTRLEHQFAADDSAQPGVDRGQPDNLDAQRRRFSRFFEQLTQPLDDGLQIEGRGDFIVFDQIFAELDLPDRQRVESRFERLFGEA